MRVSNAALYQLIDQPHRAQQRSSGVDAAPSASSQTRTQKHPAERIIQGELLEKRSARAHQNTADVMSGLFDSQANLHLREQRSSATESQHAIQQYQTTASATPSMRTTGVALDLFA